MRQSSQQITPGLSHYRLTNLVVGHRYDIKLDDVSDRDLVLSGNLSGGATAQCDPSYSGSTRCVLAPTVREVDLQVDGDNSLFGASFTINAQKINDASAFEGTWHTPVSLSVPNTDVVHHFGQSDRFSSYYQLSGLDAQRRYRIQLSGNTTPARLKLNSPITSLPVYAPQCRNVDNNTSNGDQVCVISSETSASFRVESVSANTQLTRIAPFTGVWIETAS